MTAPPGRLYSVDVLRAFAVVLVMLTHLPFSQRGLGDVSGGGIYPPQPWVQLMEYGKYGVHIFLVISGFCIHQRWARQGDLDLTVDFLSFWRRRLSRLYPPYLVALVGSLSALFLFHGLVAGGIEGPVQGWFGYESLSLLAIDIVLLLLLAQNLNGASHRVGNGPFWSLALEEQLYVLYFPLLHLRRRYGWTTTFVVIGVITMAWRMLGVQLFESPPGFWNVVGPAFWFPWALGAWGAEAVQGIVRAPRWVTRTPTLLLALAAGLAVKPPMKAWEPVVSPTIFADLTFGIFGFFLLMWAVQREVDRPSTPLPVAVRGFAQVGVWSYSIYLVHDVVFTGSKQVFIELGLPNELTLLLRFASGALAGWLLYQVIERRSLERSRRYPVPLVRAPVRKSLLPQGAE